MEKTTLVLGASPKPERVSFTGIRMLRQRGIPVVAVGIKESMAGDVKILKQIPTGLSGIHTVTMYMSARHQEEYYDRILSLAPRRIIFNPGTRNDELADMAAAEGIEVVEACMLVMLKTGIY